MSRNIKHNRRSIRLPGFDYAEGNWFYVTLCTHQHKMLFGNVENGKMHFNKFGNIERYEWLNTKKIRDNVDLDYYVIMPNHLHGILIITHKESRDTELRTPTTESFGRPVPGSLPTIIRSFKATVTKQINELRGSPGKPVWQRNYYERIIRNEKELCNIRNYILNKPR